MNEEMTGSDTAIEIAVMAKAPLPGFAKTRLIPALGPAGAARLQRRLTQVAVGTARQAQIGPVTLWCAPDAAHRFFRALSATAGIARQVQPSGDLGQRMLHAFDRHCRRRPLLLIGTDCPALTPEHLRWAAATLAAGHDAVFVPALDGGYVLIGMRRPLPRLFDAIDWSTASVMAQTRERLRDVGASWREGPTLWDVDRPDDLPRLEALWAAAHPLGAVR